MTALTAMVVTKGWTLLFILWGYFTCGLVTALYMELTSTRKNSVERTDVIDLLVGITLWPLFVVLSISDAIGSWKKAIQEARRNTKAVKEVAGLKEEIERLKDKLYELER